MKAKYLSFLVPVLFLTGCTTFRTVRISYQIDENQPVKSTAVPVDEKPAVSSRIDFDANPRQTIIGAITGNDSKKPRGNSALEIYGGVYERAKNPYEEDEMYNVNMANTKKADYVWKGYMIWRDMKAYSYISFKTKKADKKYNFIIQYMDCGTVSMTSHLEYGNKTAKVPLKIFTATDGSEKYEVYITQDKNYVAFGADSANASLVEKHTPKSSTRDLIKMKGQVIQIMDSAGNVVAQIVDGKYSLYIQEDDPRTASVMQVAALVGTYLGMLDIMD